MPIRPAPNAIRNEKLGDAAAADGRLDDPVAHRIGITVRARGQRTTCSTSHSAQFKGRWCISISGPLGVPCRESFPWMNRLQGDLGRDGLVVIAVNVDRWFLR
jgi:hypothetical protein